ncbi:MAG: hypothetical protein ACTSRF_11645, partial [Candidatus Freyarchaeota archaeon]
MGLSVVGWRRCVPLSLKPVPFGAFPADLVLWALGEAERLGLRVDVLLLDPGLPQRGGRPPPQEAGDTLRHRSPENRGDQAPAEGPRQEQAARSPLPDEGPDTLGPGGGRGHPRRLPRKKGL